MRKLSVADLFAELGDAGRLDPQPANQLYGNILVVLIIPVVPGLMMIHSSAESVYAQI